MPGRASGTWKMLSKYLMNCLDFISGPETWYRHLSNMTYSGRDCKVLGFTQQAAHSEASLSTWVSATTVASEWVGLSLGQQFFSCSGLTISLGMFWVYFLNNYINYNILVYYYLWLNVLIANLCLKHINSLCPCDMGNCVNVWYPL